MKTKKTDKKLILKKSSVASLEKVKMKGVRGGEYLPADVELTDVEFRRRRITVD